MLHQSVGSHMQRHYGPDPWTPSVEISEAGLTISHGQISDEICGILDQDAIAAEQLDIRLYPVPFEDQLHKTHRLFLAAGHPARENFQECGLAIDPDFVGRAILEMSTRTKWAWQKMVVDSEWVLDWVQRLEEAKWITREV